MAAAATPGGPPATPSTVVVGGEAGVGKPVVVEVVAGPGPPGHGAGRRPCVELGARGCVGPLIPALGGSSAPWTSPAWTGCPGPGPAELGPPQPELSPLPGPGPHGRDPVRRQVPRRGSVADACRSVDGCPPPRGTGRRRGVCSSAAGADGNARAERPAAGSWRTAGRPLDTDCSPSFRNLRHGRRAVLTYRLPNPHAAPPARPSCELDRGRRSIAWVAGSARPRCGHLAGIRGRRSPRPSGRLDPRPLRRQRLFVWSARQAPSAVAELPSEPSRTCWPCRAAGPSLTQQVWPWRSLRGRVGHELLPGGRLPEPS